MLNNLDKYSLVYFCVQNFIQNLKLIKSKVILDNFYIKSIFYWFYSVYQLVVLKYKYLNINYLTSKSTLINVNYI